MKSTNS